MRRALPILCLGCVLVSPLSSAGQTAQTLFVPVVAHLPASDGGIWKSDLRLYNAYAQGALVHLAFLRSGQDNSHVSEVPVIVPTTRTLLLEDVVLSTFGLQDYGAIRIQSPVPLVASSSTYNVLPSPGPDRSESRRETFQTVALDYSEWSSVAERVLFLANRFSNFEAAQSVRDSTTNVGFINPNPDPIFVFAYLIDDEQSTSLGSLGLTLPPYGFVQIVDLFGAFGAAGSRIDNARLSVQAAPVVSEGWWVAAVVAYAVRQTATTDTCGGLVKQADFLLAEPIPR